jgi:poly-gamma-glutamate capsule biosynthesis protein CapA/YwtB (metallophosphatase superfamily)
MDVLRFAGDFVVLSQTGLQIPKSLDRSLVFNLEGPLTSEETTASGKICLKQDPQAFESIVSEVKPRAVCLANNHIMDYGEAGLRDTIRELDRLGIPYFGAGGIDECNNPLILEAGGVSVALLGYVCPTTHPIFATAHQAGVVPPDLNRIARDIDRARSSGAGAIVVSIHWGDEEVTYPKLADIRLAREISKLGVDLLIGHHAHCRQPWGQVGGMKVFFGLGNALFPDFSYEISPGLEAWGKQRGWNRTSQLVEFDPASGQVRSNKMYQEVRTWRIAPSAELEGIRIEEADSDDSMHLERYTRAHRFGMARLAASRLIARPRLPKLSSIRHAVESIVRGR